MEARFTLLKQDGNELVKKGQFQSAMEKYSECLKLKPTECSIYTNRYLRASTGTYRWNV